MTFGVPSSKQAAPYSNAQLPRVVGSNMGLQEHFPSTQLE
jgi:hypothetical protein